MSPHHRLDELLDQAEDKMGSALRRIRKLLEEDPDEPFDLEKGAFGPEVESPAEKAARLAEERRVETPSPDRPPLRGVPHWRELFRKNWPEGPRKGRRR